jgi:hypothetical protein
MAKVQRRNIANDSIADRATECTLFAAATYDMSRRRFCGVERTLPWSCVDEVHTTTYIAIVETEQIAGPEAKFWTLIRKATSESRLTSMYFQSVGDDGKACGNSQDLPSHRDVVILTRPCDFLFAMLTQGREAGEKQKRGQNALPPSAPGLERNTTKAARSSKKMVASL